MKLKIPPAVIFLAHLGLAWLLYKYLGAANVHFPGQNLAAKLLMLAGSLGALWSVYCMFKASTTIDPIFPDRASRLLTTGIFSISRNPIYLALLILLMAWVLWLGNLVGLLLFVTFVWHMSNYQISAEEKALEEKFGDEYREYKKKVRRWI